MALLLVLTVVPLAADAATFVYNGGIRTIDPDSYLLVRGVKALDNAGLSCNVTVFYGPNVDVLVMDKANFESYKLNAPFSYLGLSRLNVSTAFIASAVGELLTGTEYYLVIDNSDRPSGGASPPSENGRSQIVYEFGAANVQIVDSGFNFLILAMIIALAVVVVVILVVLFLVMRKKRKPDLIPPYQTFPELKVCPRCGIHVSAEHQFCPNCGNRLR
jgi:hypothetical protein